jgi:hypothetical protein
MINDNYNISKIDNAADLKSIIDFCLNKYGTFVSLKVFSNNGEYDNYYSYDDQILSQIDFSKSTEFMIAIMDEKKELILAKINKAEKKLSVKEVDKKIETKKAFDVVDNPEQYIDDKRCYYYLFENGCLVKFDPDENLYYMYNKDVGWKQNNAPLSWLYDNNRGYEEIFTPKRGR